MSKIQLETFYPFTPELVWEALTDSASLKQWLMDNDFEPRVGHRFQFRAKPQKYWRGIVDGEVLEVSKPSRLVYTWKGDEKDEPTTVTWILQAEANGTRLRLEHTGFKGVGGFVLSKLILGPGWKKLLQKYLPIVLDHVRKNGTTYESGAWLIPEKKCYSAEGVNV
jgi:uncharacterized protein YndB with AHSA1/START domain